MATQADIQEHISIKRREEEKELISEPPNITLSKNYPEEMKRIESETDSSLETINCLEKTEPVLVDVKIANQNVCDVTEDHVEGNEGKQDLGSPATSNTSVPRDYEDGKTLGQAESEVSGKENQQAEITASEDTPSQENKQNIEEPTGLHKDEKEGIETDRRTEPKFDNHGGGPVHTSAMAQDLDVDIEKIGEDCIKDHTTGNPTSIDMGSSKEDAQERIIHGGEDAKAVSPLVEIDKEIDSEEITNDEKNERAKMSGNDIRDVFISPDNRSEERVIKNYEGAEEKLERTSDAELPEPSSITEEPGTVVEAECHAIIESSKKTTDATSTKDEAQDKNYFATEMEDLCFDKGEQSETIKDVFETGPQEITKESQNDQTETVDKIVCTTNILSTSCENDEITKAGSGDSVKSAEGLKKEGEELALVDSPTRECVDEEESTDIVHEDVIVADKDCIHETSQDKEDSDNSLFSEKSTGGGVVNMDSEKFEATASTQHEVAITNIEEQRQQHEENLKEERRESTDHADAAIRKEIPEEKSLSLLDLNEETGGAEVEITTVNTIDSYITHQGAQELAQKEVAEHDSVSRSEFEEHACEANTVLTEEEKYLGEETSRSPNRSISEDMSTEGEPYKERGSKTSEEIDNLAKNCPLDSEEKSQILDARRNEDESSKLEESSARELQEITTKGDENEKNLIEENVPVVNNNIICLKEEADSSFYQETESSKGRSLELAELNGRDNEIKNDNDQVSESPINVDVGEKHEKQTTKDSAKDQLPEPSIEEKIVVHEEDKAEVTQKTEISTSYQGSEKTILGDEDVIQVHSTTSFQEDITANSSKEGEKDHGLLSEDDSNTISGNQTIDRDDMKEDSCVVPGGEVTKASEYERDEAKTETGKQNIEEGIKTELPSSTLGEVKDDKILTEEESVAMKLREQVKEADRDQEEHNFGTTCPVEEPEPYTLQIAAEPTGDETAKVANSTSMEIQVKESVEDLVGNSTMAKVSEKETKEETQEKRELIVAEITEETCSKKIKQEDEINSDSSRGEDLITVEFAEVNDSSLIGEPVKASNLDENSRMEVTAAVQGRADDAGEKIEHETPNETHDASQKCENPQEDSTSETLHHTSELKLNESSALMSEEHDTMKTEVCETRYETSEKLEASDITTYTTSATEATEEKLQQEDKSESLGDDTNTGLIVTGNRSTNAGGCEVPPSLSTGKSHCTSEKAKILESMKSDEPGKHSEIGDVENSEDKTLQTEFEKGNDEDERPVNEAHKSDTTSDASTEIRKAIQQQNSACSLMENIETKKSATESEAQDHSQGIEPSETKNASTLAEENYELVEPREQLGRTSEPITENQNDERHIAIEKTRNEEQNMEATEAETIAEKNQGGQMEMNEESVPKTEVENQIKLTEGNETVKDVIFDKEVPGEVKKEDASEKTEGTNFEEEGCSDQAEGKIFEEEGCSTKLPKMPETHETANEAKDPNDVPSENLEATDSTNCTESQTAEDHRWASETSSTMNEQRADIEANIEDPVKVTSSVIEVLEENNEEEDTAAAAEDCDDKSDSAPLTPTKEQTSFKEVQVDTKPVTISDATSDDKLLKTTGDNPTGEDIGSLKLDETSGLVSHLTTMEREDACKESLISETRETANEAKDPNDVPSEYLEATDSISCTESQTAEDHRWASETSSTMNEQRADIEANIEDPVKVTSSVIEVLEENNEEEDTAVAADGCDDKSDSAPLTPTKEQTSFKEVQVDTKPVTISDATSDDKLLKTTCDDPTGEDIGSLKLDETSGLVSHLTTMEREDACKESLISETRETANEAKDPNDVPSEYLEATDSISCTESQMGEDHRWASETSSTMNEQRADIEANIEDPVKVTSSVIEVIEENNKEEDTTAAADGCDDKSDSAPFTPTREQTSFKEVQVDIKPVTIPDSTSDDKLLKTTYDDPTGEDIGSLKLDETSSLVSHLTTVEREAACKESLTSETHETANEAKDPNDVPSENLEATDAISCTESQTAEDHGWASETSSTMNEPRADIEANIEAPVKVTSWVIEVLEENNKEEDTAAAADGCDDKSDSAPFIPTKEQTTFKEVQVDTKPVTISDATSDDKLLKTTCDDPTGEDIGSLKLDEISGLVSHLTTMEREDACKESLIIENPVEVGKTDAVSESETSTVRNALKEETVADIEDPVKAATSDIEVLEGYNKEDDLAAAAECCADMSDTAPSTLTNEQKNFEEVQLETKSVMISDATSDDNLRKTMHDNPTSEDGESLKLDETSGLVSHLTTTESEDACKESLVTDNPVEVEISDAVLESETTSTTNALKEETKRAIEDPGKATSSDIEVPGGNNKEDDTAVAECCADKSDTAPSTLTNEQTNFEEVQLETKCVMISDNTSDDNLPKTTYDNPTAEDGESLKLDETSGLVSHLTTTESEDACKESLVTDNPVEVEISDAVLESETSSTMNALKEESKTAIEDHGKVTSSDIEVLDGNNQEDDTTTAAAAECCADKSETAPSTLTEEQTSSEEVQLDTKSTYDNPTGEDGESLKLDETSGLVSHLTTAESKDACKESLIAENPVEVETPDAVLKSETATIMNTLKEETKADIEDPVRVNSSDIQVLGGNNNEEDTAAEECCADKLDTEPPTLTKEETSFEEVQIDTKSIMISDTISDDILCKTTYDNSTGQDIESLKLDDASGLVSHLTTVESEDACKESPIAENPVEVEKPDAVLKSETFTNMNALQEETKADIEDPVKTTSSDIEVLEGNNKEDDTTAAECCGNKSDTTPSALTKEQTSSEKVQLDIRSAMIFDTTSDDKLLKTTDNNSMGEEIESLKIDETSGLVSQPTTMESEDACKESLIIQNPVGIETADAVSESRQEDASEIEKTDIRPFVERSETDRSQKETKEALEIISEPQIMSEPHNQGIEVVTEGDLSPDQTLACGSLAKQLQEPSSAGPSKEQDHETKTTAETTKDESIKKEGTPSDKNQECYFGKGAKEDMFLQKENPDTLEASHEEVEHIKNRQNDSLNGAADKERTTVEEPPAIKPREYVKPAILPSDGEKSIEIQKSMLCGYKKTSNDESSDSGNSNICEMSKEISNDNILETEKTERPRSQVDTTEAFSKQEGAEMMEEHPDAATNERRDEVNESEKAYEANEIMEDEISSRQILTETGDTQDPPVVYTDEETIETRYQKDKDILEKVEYPVEETSAENIDQNEETIEESRAIKDPNEVLVADRTVYESLLEEAAEEKNAESVDNVDFKGQGDETSLQDTEKEATDPTQEATSPEVELEKHDENRKGSLFNETAGTNDKELQTTDHDVPPATDEAVKDTPYGEEVCKKVGEISEPVSGKPIHEVTKTCEIKKGRPEEETNSSETLVGNKTPDNSTSEPAFERNNLTEDRKLQEQGEEAADKEENNKSENKEQLASLYEKAITEEMSVTEGNSIEEQEALDHSEQGSMMKLDEGIVDLTKANQIPQDKNATAVQQEASAETFQDLIKDSEPQIASETQAQTGKIYGGAEKGTGHECIETTEKSIGMESSKIALSDLTQKSIKQTSQVDQQSEDIKVASNRGGLKGETAEAAEVEEEKRDEENDEREEGNEKQLVDSGSDAPVMVEVSRDMDVKVAHKKSHNILFGVGSKVKHSIAKVKKVITGKSSHPKPPSPK